MRHHSYSLPKKLTFAEFANERTDGRTNERKKKQTSKVPFRINARELKKVGNTDGLYFFKVDFRKFRNPCCTSLLLASVYFASTMNGIDLGGSKGGHLRSDT